LKWLDLSWNNIGDDGFIAIASCIENFEELRIGSSDDSNLTMRGITKLIEAVLKLSANVRA